MRSWLALLLLLAGLAHGQGLSVRGEAGIDTGVRYTSLAGAQAIGVPVVVRALLEVDADLAESISFHGVLLPAIGSGARPDEPLLSLGLQEAYLEMRTGGVDLSAGFQRLPLAQMRLLTPLSIEPTLATGEPRGPLTVRVHAYTGPWRIRGAAVGVTGDDLLPEGAGGLASLRFESSLATIEGHGLWSVRPAAGLTASASVGSLVVYGEGWLLADPWEGRGGIGVTGYLGEWLWTAESAWAPAGGGLRAVAMPALAANLSRPLGFDGSVDIYVVGSWPTSASAPGKRVTQLDAAVALRQDRGDATLTVTPALHLGEGIAVASLGVSLRAYY